MVQPKETQTSVSHFFFQCALTLKALIFLCKPWRPRGFIQFEVIINEVIINRVTLTVRGSTLVVRI